MADNNTQDYCVHASSDMSETYGGTKRSDLPDSAFVFPDERTFPVMTSQDVKDAVSSWGRYKGKHSFDDFKTKLKARAGKIGASKSLPEKWADEGAPSEYAGFEFADLGQLVNGKPFDGVASGHFVDMAGRPVDISTSDLQAMVTNTNHAIESTRTSNGDVVGLPIDMNMHDHRGGAGWIVGATLDAVRNIIQFSVKWTDQGAQAIRDSLVRFFSPSIDPVNQVVMGGSLINYPATKNKDGTFILKPIELSSMLQGSELQAADKSFNLGDVVSAFLTSLGLRGEGNFTVNQNSRKENDNDMTTIAELAQTEQGKRELAALIEAQSNQRVVELLATEKNKLHLAELAKSWTGGDKDHQFGLPVKDSELVEFMSSLTQDQQKKAEALFTGIWQNGLVDFKEKGHGGKRDDLKELPAEVALGLDNGTIKVSDLSNPILALGDLKQYDLTKWQGGGNVDIAKMAAQIAVELAKGGVK